MEQNNNRSFGILLFFFFIVISLWPLLFKKRDKNMVTCNGYNIFGFNYF